jgi:hypothetical protein
MMPFIFRHKSLVLCYGVFLAAMLALPARVDAGTEHASRLKEKIGQIASLRKTLVRQYAQAFELREKLKEQMVELKREVKAEVRSAGTSSYREVISRRPRIAHDLKLLQIILAYVSKLNQKIRLLQTGHDELEFIFQQAEDDLRIKLALKEMDNEGLMRRIDQACGKYEQEAQGLMIKTSDFVPVPTEDLWKTVLKGE